MSRVMHKPELVAGAMSVREDRHEEVPMGLAQILANDPRLELDPGKKRVTQAPIPGRVDRVEVAGTDRVGTEVLKYFGGERRRQRRERAGRVVNTPIAHVQAVEPGCQRRFGK